MFLLCMIGIHKDRWHFVGDPDNMISWVKACVRCGQEPGYR